MRVRQLAGGRAESASACCEGARWLIDDLLAEPSGDAP
jgi:hypothetical protein